MEALLREVANLYETVSISRTLVLALDEDEAEAFTSQLTAMDHSVCVITSDDLQDDRPKYMDKLMQFNNLCNRVLVITFAAWQALKKELEIFAMDHNLLVVGDLESQRIRIFLTWVLDAHDHGFCNKDGEHITLFLENYL
jgi:hypothetical protein